MTRLKGISIIVLIITIIVMIIIAGVTILSLAGSDVIARAKETRFRRDIKSFEDEYDIWVSDVTINNPRVDLSKVHANKEYVTGLERIPEINDITDILTSFKKNNDYIDKIIILNGKLKTNDINLSNEELEIAINIGLDSSDSYIKSNLLLHYDGINNTGIGHSSTITSWKNLIENGIDGTLTNFNNNASSGTTDSGLIFDGLNDCVNVEGNSSMNIDNYLSIMAWVKFDNVANLTRIGNIIGNYGHTPHFNFEAISYGRLRFYWKSGEIDLLSATDLRGGWHNVAVVRNKIKDTITLYIDGVFNVQKTAGTNLDIKLPLRIGDDYRNTDSPGIPFHGTINSILLYNSALTVDEIKQNYEINKIRFGI